MNSDTPQTDEEIIDAKHCAEMGFEVVLSAFARRLENELQLAREQVEGLTQQLALRAEMEKEGLLPDEVIYRIYARHVSSEQWHPQQSSIDKEDVLYWLERNRKQNAETFVEGAGREYIAVKVTTRFELI